MSVGGLVRGGEAVVVEVGAWEGLRGRKLAAASRAAEAVAAEAMSGVHAVV
jgi:hypothetical protein